MSVECASVEMIGRDEKRESPFGIWKGSLADTQNRSVSAVGSRAERVMEMDTILTIEYDDITD